MFYIFYRYRINKNIKDETKDTINEQENNESDSDKECILCLEKNNKNFYDYDYKDNKFIHNCKCRPPIHYECFLENYYKKNGACIICLETIERKNDCNCVILFKVRKLKVMCLWIFFVLLIYTLYENIDVFVFYNLKKEDLTNDEYSYI